MRAARERGLELAYPDGARESPGHGVRGVVGGREVALGRLEYVLNDAPAPRWARRARRRSSALGSAVVFVAVDQELAGALVLEDPLRIDTPRTLRALRQAGLRRIVLLTGDHPEVAEAVGAVIGADEVLAERSPQEKVEAVAAESGHGGVVMVGDGLNDAAALAAADIGVAMGVRGSAASVESADIVLAVDRLDRLEEALAIARRTQRIARQSVLAGMGLSLAAMAAAAAGALPPAAGALVQELIDVAVILNALRALGGRRADRPPSAESERIRREHRELRPEIARLREVADRLEELPAPAARAELEGLRALLEERLLPHERREEAQLYPLVAAAHRRRRSDRHDEPGPRRDRALRAPVRQAGARAAARRAGGRGPPRPAPAALRAGGHPAPPLRAGGRAVPRDPRRPGAPPGRRLNDPRVTPRKGGAARSSAHPSAAARPPRQRSRAAGAARYFAAVKKGTAMNRKPVLLAASLVEGSTQLLRTAHRVSRLLGVPLHIVYVLRQRLRWEEEVIEEIEGAVRERIARQITRLAIPKREIGETIVRRGQPHQVILEEARRLGAGLIVLRGSERGGLRIGSTTDRVLRQSELPVLVVRGVLRLPLRNALFTADLAPLGMGILRCGAGSRPRPRRTANAQGGGAARGRRHAPGVPDFAGSRVPEELTAAADALSLLITQADGPESPMRRRVVRGYPVVEILRRIRDLRPDLVILGTHATGGLERFLLGSVAADVVRSAPCSALVIPPEAAQASSVRELRAERRSA